MRAVMFHDGVVGIGDRPRPSPGESEVLVAVRAAGLNNTDLLQLDGQRFGQAPSASRGTVPGVEFAGEVVETGRGVKRFGVGTRLMGLTAAGGQAEFLTVHEDIAVEMPSSMSWEKAGAFPEAFVTAHDALFTQAALAAGERLLIHGGAGGVGSAAVQLGRSAGATVTATVRNPALHARVEALGAQVLHVDALSTVPPFDVILEVAGTPDLASDLSVLGTCGRIVIVGGSGKTVPLSLGLLKNVRGRVMGTRLRTRSHDERVEATRRVESDVLPLLTSGAVDVPIEAVFPLEEAEAAYQRFRQGGKFGKIVLAIP